MLDKMDALGDALKFLAKIITASFIGALKIMFELLKGIVLVLNKAIEGWQIIFGLVGKAGKAVWKGLGLDEFKGFGALPPEIAEGYGLTQSRAGNIASNAVNNRSHANNNTITNNINISSPDPNLAGDKVIYSVENQLQNDLDKLNFGY
jgi:hypothetical protein